MFFMSCLKVNKIIKLTIMGKIKKILEYLTEDSFVFVNDFNGWGEEALPEGFTWGKGGPEENCLMAADGNSLSLQSTTLRRGNHLTVSLRRNGKEVETVKLEDLFPDQDVVIATSGEILRFFAPVCKSKRELIKFFAELDDFCSVHKENICWHLQGYAEDLALWLYHHNPNRVQERDYGI